MFISTDPDEDRFTKVEQTILELQEKRARLGGRKVVNQAQVVDWLSKGLMAQEEITEEEHIAIFGLPLADWRREQEAWEALRQSRDGILSYDGGKTRVHAG